MFLLSLVLMTSIARSATYSIENTWKNKKPNILICKDSKTKKETIDKAIDFWTKEGFKIGNISYDKSNKCSKAWIYDTILVYGQRDLKSEHNGLTQPWLDSDTGKLVSATIKIDTRLANELELIKHEIGHALGVNHSNDYDNTMYPYHSY